MIFSILWVDGDYEYSKDYQRYDGCLGWFCQSWPQRD